MAVLFVESWQPNELVYKLQRFDNLFHTLNKKRKTIILSVTLLRQENLHQYIFGFVLIYREKRDKKLSKSLEINPIDFDENSHQTSQSWWTFMKHKTLSVSLCY